MTSDPHFDADMLADFLSQAEEADDSPTSPGVKMPQDPLSQRPEHRRGLFGGAGRRRPLTSNAGQAEPVASLPGGASSPQRNTTNNSGNPNGRRGLYSVAAQAAAARKQAASGGDNAAAATPPPSGAQDGGSTGNGDGIDRHSEAPTGSADRWIRLACHCGHRMRLKPNKAGQTIRCPKCEQSLRVPAGSSPGTSAVTAKASFPARLAEHIAELEAELASGPNPEKRRTLSWFAFRSLSNTVQNALAGRGNPEAARKAVEELGESEDGRAFELLKGVWEAERGDLQSTVLQAIGRLRDLRGHCFLLQLLTHHLPEVRVYAVQGLGQSQDSRVVLPLMEYGESDPERRYVVGDAVLKIGDPAIRPLVKLLNGADEPLAREAAVLLGRLKADAAGKSLIETISHRTGPIRGLAAEALGLIGDVKAAPTIVPLLQDPDDKVRVQAAKALSRIPHASCLAALVKGLEDQHPEVRQRCASALGEIGDSRSATALVKLLDDPHQDMRIAAAEALGRIGDSRAAPSLIKLLHDPDEAIVGKAIAALKRIQRPEAVPELSQLLFHQSPRIRQKAVDALGSVGDAVVAEQIEQILKTDRSEEVRAAAAKALGEIRDPGSVEALLEAVHDAFAVRCRAIVALGELGEDGAVPQLFALLQDPAPEIRYHASGALAELGHAPSVKAIESLLADPNAMVRRGAAKALEKLGQGDAEQILGNSAKQGLRRTRQGMTSVLTSLTPNALFGLVTGGSAVQRAVVVGVLLVPLLAAAAYWWISTEETRTQVVVRGFLNSVAFDQAGERLWSGRTTGVVEYWNPESKRREGFFLPFETNPPILGPAAAPDGQSVVVAGGTEAGAFDLDGNLLWSIDGHPQPFVELRATKDGRQVMARSSDGIVSFWNLEDGSRIGAGAIQLPRDRLGVTDLSNTATMIAGVGTKGPISIWSTRDGSAVGGDLTGVTDRVSALSFSPDDTLIAAGTTKGTIALWDIASGELRTQITADPPGPISRLAFSDDGGTIYMIISSTYVGVLNLETQTFARHLVDGPELIKTLSVSPDGKRVALGGDADSPIWIFDLAEQEVVGELDIRE